MARKNKDVVVGMGLALYIPNTRDSMVPLLVEAVLDAIEADPKLQQYGVKVIAGGEQGEFKVIDSTGHPQWKGGLVPHGTIVDGSDEENTDNG